MSLRPRAWVPTDHENRLAEFRTDAGMTIRALAEKVGKGLASVRAVELCDAPPTNRDGSLKSWVAAACNALGRPVEGVFPHQYCAWRPDEFVPEQIYGAIMCREPQDVEDAIDVHMAMRSLAKKNRRRADVVWMRCQGWTHRDIASRFGISVEYARNIELRGLSEICKLMGYDEKGRE